MRAQKTVGEMIASHHWRDANDRARSAERAFLETDIGRAFLEFKNALGHAWQRDGQEHVSDKALRVAWQRADDAERMFMTHLNRALAHQK